MKFSALSFSLLCSLELISAFVAPHTTTKKPSPTRLFLITDYQATRHPDQLVDRLDDVFREDGYARPDPNSLSPETSREWITRKMNPRRVPNVVRNYEGRNRFGSNAYASLADRFERDLEEEMEHRDFEMEMMDRDMYERDLAVAYRWRDGGEDMDYNNRLDFHRSPRDEIITMQVLLDMDLHYMVPADFNSKLFDDLSPRERLFHKDVFVMEGSLLRAKQLPENVYFVELLQHDLDEYMEMIMYDDY